MLRFGPLSDFAFTSSSSLPRQAGESGIFLQFTRSPPKKLWELKSLKKLFSGLAPSLFRGIFLPSLVRSNHIPF